MVLDDDLLGLLLFPVRVEPARRLGQEEDEEDDEAGEEQLDPRRDEPGLVASVVLAGAEGAGREDAADVVDGVVEAGHDAAVGGVGDLDDVDGRGGGGDAVAKAEEEAAAEELAEAAAEVGGALDDGADDDAHAADEHADAAAPGVDGGADEGQGADAADGVEGGDVAGLDADDGGAELGVKGGHDEHVAHEAAVVAVDARAEEGDADDGVELEHVAVPFLWRFLLEGGLERLVALHGDLVHADMAHFLFCGGDVAAPFLGDGDALDILIAGLLFHLC